MSVGRRRRRLDRGNACAGPREDAGLSGRAERAGNTGFERYRASLIASWEALAAAHPDAAVIRGAGFVAARFGDPVFNNAILSDAAALAAAEAVYAGEPAYTLWCLDDQREIAGALTRRGYRPTESTRPMVCALDGITPGDVTARADADPRLVAELNGVAPDTLRGVPGLRAYADGGGDSVLVLLPAGTDVNVSFVATRPAARGRGLATAVLRAALLDARRSGARTASLQATPMAEPLYARIGFRAVGRWQEWSPSDLLPVWTVRPAARPGSPN